MKIIIEMNRETNEINVSTDEPSDPVEMINIFTTLIRTAVSQIKLKPKVQAPEKPNLTKPNGEPL